MVTNNIEEYKGVYVFAQQVDNEISGIALELLGKGKELAAKLETEVTAVLIGYNVKGLADKLAEYGADKVILVDDPELETYRTEPYAHALASVIEKYKPPIGDEKNKGGTQWDYFMLMKMELRLVMKQINV